MEGRVYPSEGTLAKIRSMIDDETRSVVGEARPVAFAEVTSGKYAYTVEIDTYVSLNAEPAICAGVVTWGGGRHMIDRDNAHIEARHFLDPYRSHSALKERLDPFYDADGLEAKLKQEKGSVTLVEPQIVSYSHETCEGCSGHGGFACSRCNGNGKTHCYHCSVGRVRCGSCGGRGGTRDAGGHWHSCSCGDGWRTCNWCWGSTRLACVYCNKSGRIGCGPCGETGHFTYSVTCSVVVEHSVRLGLPKLPPPEQSAFKRWVLSGIAGVQSDEQAEGPYGECEFGIHEKGIDNDRFKFVTKIGGHIRRVAASGTVGGKPFTMTAPLFEDPSLSVSPYLDEDVREIAAWCADAGKLGPKAAQQAAGTNIRPLTLVESMRTGAGAPTAVDYALRGSVGSVTSGAMAELAKAYGGSLASFTKRAWHRGWLYAVILSACLVGLTFLLDVPWVVRLLTMPTPTPFVLASVAYGAALALVAWTAATLAARHAIAKESGRGACLSRSPIGRLGAFATCVVAGTLFSWPLIYGREGVDPIRYTMIDVRAATGIPSIGNLLYGR